MKKLENVEGMTIPPIVFRTRKAGAWNDLSTEQLFKGRRVVLFALPGAFTPTCSSRHLPRYETLFPEFQQRGIDDVVCLSVNDGFVMEAWARDQGIENVTMLPDGNGELSQALGMLVDKGHLGFGTRSWRYSMIVDDGQITKMFIESEEPGDPFEVSDADTMLDFIDPDSRESRPPESEVVCTL